MTRAETKNIKEKMEYTVDPSFEGLRSTCKIVIHFFPHSDTEPDNRRSRHIFLNQYKNLHFSSYPFDVFLNNFCKNPKIICDS